MEKLILAIETSCDETAMCIIDTNKKVYAHVVNSQAQAFESLGGVVPELASRMHVDNIFYVFLETLQQANVTIQDIDYIAVTTGPGLIGSLLVGINFANSLALLYNIKLIPINHMQAHIYANSLTTDLIYPHLALIISGGHSDLVYLDKPLHFQLIGQTLDDALGETYDKIARLLGLSYPGGPIIEKKAQLGTCEYQLPMPKKDQSLDFSFSGLKAACYNLVNHLKMKQQDININNFCASFQNTINNILLYKLQLALQQYDVKQISVSGGVSCNQSIQATLKAHFDNIIFPNKALSTDNALMVGLLAVNYLNNNQAIFKKQLNALPNINVEYQWDKN